MEKKVGERFELDGDLIEVVETTDSLCDGCYLENLERYCHEKRFGHCYHCTRSDNKNVIFKLVKE